MIYTVLIERSAFKQIEKISEPEYSKKKKKKPKISLRL
jgi:mRNA-degrading endonuclease RelE of RelBE toxin-antitoxin system